MAISDYFVSRILIIPALKIRDDSFGPFEVNMGTLVQNKIIMRIFQIALLGSLLHIGACAHGQASQQETRWVDDILFDGALDDPQFKLCNTEEQVIQYFNDGKSIQYEGGKPAIDAIFSAGYQPVAKNESGLVRIRFIVNCLGETGRFRLMSACPSFPAGEKTAQF